MWGIGCVDGVCVHICTTPSTHAPHIPLSLYTIMQVVPCLALYDTMRHINSDVATVGFGACFGMSGFLLAVGKKVRVIWACERWW